MFSRISSSSSSSIVIVLILLFPSTIVNASRAYPHGCLYRHPSYYTYDERDDVTWSSSTSNDEDEYYIDFRRLPSKSSKLRRPYTRYKLIRRLGAGKFSDVFEAVDVQWQQQKLLEEHAQKQKKRENVEKQLKK